MHFNLFLQGHVRGSKTSDPFIIVEKAVSERRSLQELESLYWLIDSNYSIFFQLKFFSSFEPFPNMWKTLKNRNRCMKIHKNTHIQNSSKTNFYKIIIFFVDGKKCHLRCVSVRVERDEGKLNSKHPLHIYRIKCIIIIKWCTHIFIPFHTPLA